MQNTCSPTSRPDLVDSETDHVVEQFVFSVFCVGVARSGE